MKREFLEEMGLEKEQIDKILDANSTDVGKAKKIMTTSNRSLTRQNSSLQTQTQPLRDSETMKKSKVR